ncbi:MAG: hypothetical protein AAGF75_05535, partial [Cyanobacteria bacterium P01_H01_bin.130]
MLQPDVAKCGRRNQFYNTPDKNDPDKNDPAENALENRDRPVMHYDLSAIIEGYAQGYFLMAETDGSHLSWYSSRDRTLIPLDARFRYPKSLRRILNQNRFSAKIDYAFPAVVEGCAD